MSISYPGEGGGTAACDKSRTTFELITDAVITLVARSVAFVISFDIDLINMGLSTTRR